MLPHPVGEAAREVPTLEFLGIIIKIISALPKSSYV
jgi:hypothetical protein